jgi:hypothetical protein
MINFPLGPSPDMGIGEPPELSDPFSMFLKWTVTNLPSILLIIGTLISVIKLAIKAWR